MLYKKFETTLACAHNVAPNPYLTHLSDAVKSVENAALTQRPLQEYVDELSRLLDKPNFALNALLTNKFAQLLGEAHFSALCQAKGISLRRIPEEKNKKTPDFDYAVDSDRIFFEVKTLSVSGGDAGISDALESALDAQLDLEAKLRRDKGIAMAVSEAQPYGVKPYREGTVTAIVNILIEKARQNIKADQFANPNTFLALNLSIIPPSRTDNAVLRPSYPDDYLFPKAVTGDLWILAFGRPGMLIQSNPEFEGKPCVESTLEKVGILAEPDFDFVAGIIFMIHPWQRPPELWALFRSHDWEKRDDANEKMLTALLSLAGDDWNDDKDSNGWRLQGKHQTSAVDQA